MRAIVTGGLGFIGSHLVNRLISEDWDGAILDDCSNPASHGFRSRPYQKCDISSDVIPWSKSETVFHLAAVSRTPHALRRPDVCHGVNATGTFRLLDHCRKYEREARIVVASSNVVYAAWTPYKASKLAAEHYVNVYNELYGGNAIALRFSNVIGPGLREGDPAVFSALRDCKKQNGYVEVTGDGTQTREFTYVDDIVDALMLAAKSDYKGILDISSGHEHSMNEFASYFDCPIKYVAERTGDVKRIEQPNRGDAERILGWKAKTSFEEAMRKCLSE